MKTTIIIVFFITVTYSYLNETNTTESTIPPPVPCSNSLCSGKYDGNYEYKNLSTGVANKHYFVQCTSGNACCQACWPLNLEFNPICNQCLYNQYDNCITTEKWEPATTFYCPDLCPVRGHHFNGNIADHYNSKHFVACWYGVTIGCVSCPSGLEFNEYENACLYYGIYKTEPRHGFYYKKSEQDRSNAYK